MEEPQNDPTNYKWGFIYYNPNDERIWVPKRNPALGVTLNFAHKKAYWFLLPLLILPVSIVLLSVYF